MQVVFNISTYGKTMLSWESTAFAAFYLSNFTSRQVEAFHLYIIISKHLAALVRPGSFCPVSYPQPVEQSQRPGCPAGTCPSRLASSRAGTMVIRNRVPGDPDFPCVMTQRAGRHLDETILIL